MQAEALYSKTGAQTTSSWTKTRRRSRRKSKGWSFRARVAVPAVAAGACLRLLIDAVVDSAALAEAAAVAVVVGCGC